MIKSILFFLLSLMVVSCSEDNSSSKTENLTAIDSFVNVVKSKPKKPFPDSLMAENRINALRDTFYSNNFSSDTISIFLKSLVLSASDFNNNQLKNVFFYDSVYFYALSHISDDLSNITFNSMVNFIDNSALLYFKEISFRKEVLFEYRSADSIHGTLSFSDCFLNKGFSLHRNDFIEKILGYEKPLVINGEIKFTNCQINGRVNLSSCIFGLQSSLTFEHTALPDTLDLSNTKLFRIIDLKQAQPRTTGKCEINLLGADIGLINTDYQNIHLYIPDSIKNDNRYNDLINSTYKTLLNKFKENNYDDSFQELDVEYKNWQSSHNIWLWFSGWWWNYGYSKSRVVLWSVTILLIFSVVNLFIYNKLFNTYQIEQLNKAKFQFSKNSFIRSLEKYFLSLIYTGFIFFKLGIDFEKIHIKRWSILFLIFLEYFVGLLCTGYMINWILSK